ncbi:MAG: hypothetical protein PUE67_05520 [Oscillospiraceae bacterium]|nr:hypothetical protein [Oscillospiraceae bacterium]
MRKVIVWFIALFLTLSLCGCTTMQLTIEQSKENFPVYESELKEVANDYNLELIEIEDDYYKENFDENEFLIKSFNIIKDDTEIEITLRNDSINTTKGRESFYVNYVTHSSFDVSLFVNLVNCVSGKEITEDFCKEFLEAPEEKYSAEDRGFQKPSEGVIVKEYPLNFFEDWVISYYFYPESRQELSFGGLTKQLDD